MKSPIRELSTETLLRETRWLDGLARQLVSDAHRAQDVAQDAWAALAEHGGPVSELRPWLRRVTRRLASRLTHRESQRKELEAMAARPETSPSAAETVERIRVQHRVVAALLKLEEPYRSTVAMRFFEGLPPRKVASRMGVPVNTVRSRLRRALQAMRTDLDTEFGDRRVWVVPLLAKYGTTSVGTSTLLLELIMKAKVTAVAALVLIASGVWLLLANRTPPPEPGFPREGVSGRSSIQADLGTEARGSGLIAERSPVTVPPPTDTGGLEVHVLWRDDRSPVPRLTLKLIRDTADPFSREAPDLTTDADGVARLAGVDPGEYQLHAARLMPTTSAEVVPGEVREVEVLLDRHGHFHVQVTDEAGTPLPGADVHAIDSGMMARTYLGQTDADGRLELDAAGPNVSVFAEMEGHGTSEIVEIVSFPGDVMDVVLTLGRSSVALHGLVTDEAGVPVAGAEVAVQMALPKPWALNWDEGGLSYDTRPVVVTDREGRFRLPNVLPGPIVCEAHAAGYMATSVSGVLTPDRNEITIALAPGARVMGVVRNHEGDPVSHAMVWQIRRLQPPSVTRTDDRGRFSLPSLSPGTIHLSATHPEHGEANVELDVLAGETRTWEPRLDPGGVIEGQVVDQTGEPLAGLTVEVEGSGPILDPRVLTTADGRFRVRRRLDDVYRVSVMEFSAANYQALARLEGIDPGADPLHIVIADSDRPSAFLSGRVVRPAGFEQNLVRLWTFGAKPGTRIIRGVGLDGAFRIGPLSPGRYTVSSEAYKSPLGGFSFPEVELGPGEEVDLGALEIPSPTWLEISIRYPDGGEPTGSYMQLSHLEEPRSGRDSRWIRGAMRPQTYEPGRYRLRLFDLHHLPWIDDVELVGGQTTRVEAIVEPARPCRIALTLPPGTTTPATLQISLRRQGPPDQRTSQLHDGERQVPVGLGTYVAEIQDEDSPLQGSVRFTVRDLSGPELRVELPAR